MGTSKSVQSREVRSHPGQQRGSERKKRIKEEKAKIRIAAAGAAGVSVTRLRQKEQLAVTAIARSQQRPATALKAPERRGYF